ncbi:UNVERIFIED_CONTAM: hypothetical protein Sradi_5880200 [Sesamum radiatum]|uniref:BED-type domain-containing protein n=1 Tax=Sesamum radiatum TaxID=300843 RepID=A0AAW2KRP0_SESRA
MSNSQSSPTVDLSDAQGQGIHMVQNQVSDDNVDNLDFEHGCDVDKDMGMSEDEDEIPLDSKKRKKRVVTSRSPWWDHFHKFYCEKDKVQKARCKYCSGEIKADPKVHGTRPLKNHFESCKNKPHEVSTNQARLSFQSVRLGEREAPLVNWRFDQERIREALTYMLVVDELPFKTVENPKFRHFMSVACLMFSIPSRRTITKDIFHMYVNERAKLKSFIKNHAQRVCITTDTWTSIQKDGLKGKDEHEAISRIRGAIRYVRNSPARYKKLQECAEFIETKKLLSLDVPTRWNSTYLMLEAVTCLKRAFDAYEDIDLAYMTDLSKKPFDGVPIESDWDRAKLLLKFLKHFYNLTLCISGSSYVTSNIVFHEICEVDLLLKRWLNSEDVELSEMARKMKEKYDKY